MTKVLISAFLFVLTAVLVFSIGLYILNSFVFYDFSPVQPINFSHKIHAGQRGIPCLFCHIYADKSRIAGVPSVERCMGCHNSIRKDSTEIKKLQLYWEKQKPIKWVRVHDLPDYIYFPHKRHVKAGVKCQECHGPVEKMAKVTKQNNLVMGWCLYCHRTKKYTSNGKALSGPKDCWGCHV